MEADMISTIIQNPIPPTIGDVIVDILSQRNGDIGSFYAAVAFAKRSCVRLVIESLRSFINDGGECFFIIGIDQKGTSYEALHDLLDLGERVHCYINHCNNFTVTFHPKLYFVRNNEEAVVITGSGNLTTGGLFTNDEIAIKQQLNLQVDEDVAFLAQVEHSFELMRQNNCIELTLDILERLVAEHYLPRETEIQTQTRQAQQTQREVQQNNTLAIFTNSVLRRRVRTNLITREAIHQRRHDNPILLPNLQNEIPVAPIQVVADVTVLSGFLMTLHQTDVGRGQINAGTNARSPEFFVPLAARNFMPDFWGWQGLFTADPNIPGKSDRRVNMIFNGSIISVAMMTWPQKDDFRLRSEALRTDANIGDILNIQQIPQTNGCDYKVEIIHTTDANYTDYLSLCEHDVRNSQRKWGYYVL